MMLWFNLFILISFLQVFVNFAKQQSSEDDTNDDAAALHPRAAGARREAKISPIKATSAK
ncbi:MAG: hypothetical protein ACRC4N_00685 [Gammaproteobacteria bacterium]